MQKSLSAYLANRSGGSEQPKRGNDTQYSEAGLQSMCYLWWHENHPNHRGRLFLCHNNPRNSIDGARLKAQGLIAGVSDMILLRENRPPLCIEFKLPDGRQSTAQKQWQKVAESTGADYVIIRSLDEFKALFDSDHFQN